MIGRLLCGLGFHAWEHRDESDGHVEITFTRCRRCSIPERIVDVAVRAALGTGLCSCAKGRWDPECLVHGRRVA